MRGRLLVSLLGVLVLSVLLSGCGQDPKEEYARSASAIVQDWRAIIEKWNAHPGDAKVATEFVSLEARAKAIKAPDDMKSMHSLLLRAMDAEAKSFEAYAVGKKQYSATLHAIALNAMEKYEKALRNLGLIK